MKPAQLRSPTRPATTVVTATASATGDFSVAVPTPFGTSVITVAATTAVGATGYARRTVVSEFITGTTVLDVADPDGDDNGPHVRLPDVGQLQAGCVRPAALPGDRGRRERAAPGPGPRPVADIRLADRSAACWTSTCRPPAGHRHRPRRVPDPELHDRRRPRRGAAGSRWKASPTRLRRRARRVAWPDLGQASQASRFITLIVPVAALGTPGPGWTFTVVLHGQDGSPRTGRAASSRHRRSFSSACARRAGPARSAQWTRTVPKAMDVLTPAGVDQAAELDPTAPPVEIAGIPVPN